MEIDREKFIRAVEAVLPALTKKEMFTQSNMLGIRPGHLVTYNDELSIRHDFPDIGAGEIALDGVTLHDFLDHLTSETVQVEASDSELKIRSGRVRVALKTAALELPQFEVAGDEVELPETFRERIRMVSEVCATGTSRPALTCVSVTGDWVEGSDGYRLVRMECDTSSPGFLLPAKLAVRVADYPVTRMLSGNEWVHFVTADNTSVSCRVASGSYPDLTKVYDVVGKSFTLPATLRDVVDRASIFSRRENSRIDEEVRVELSPNRVVIRAHNDSGTFEEIARWAHSDVEASFSIHSDFFRIALTHGTSCQISDSKIKFAGSDWKHVVALR